MPVPPSEKGSRSGSENNSKEQQEIVEMLKKLYKGITGTELPEEFLKKLQSGESQDDTSVESSEE